MNIDWHAERGDLQELALLDRLPRDSSVDLVALRRYRLARVREEMERAGIDVCILLDPVNIRYATGSRNMQVFSSRNPARYLILPQSGPTVLFEFAGCAHLSAGLETIQEIRPAITASYAAAGDAIARVEKEWAAQVADAIAELCGRNPTVGVERANAGAILALNAYGYKFVDAQRAVERARAIKSKEELACIRDALEATNVAVERMRAALRPGLTENALWSLLHQAVIAQGGEYVETRLFTSGPHTNPWFQETGERVIQPGELVALDTDVVGCHGYYCDFSRTFHSGPTGPTARQRELYRNAYEQVRTNVELLRPGMSFLEYSTKAWDIPERFHSNRYFVSAHGCGMTGEWPYLYHRGDFDEARYAGEIQPGMVLCVESYIGDEGGSEGVKLEQQVLITESGPEILSTFPFEEALLT